jgi:nitrite reductase/ring-hydroxylating ferredoxin subunit
MMKSNMNNNKLKKGISFLIMASVLVLLPMGGCYKEQQHETIPNVAVDLYIDVNSTLYLQLNTVGGWLYLTGGYKGILVYRLSDYEFVAFDRTCPYDPYENNSRLEMDAGNLIVVDTVCDSKFVIIDGTVFEGPSTLPMKQYRTDFDGTILHIYN